MTRIWYRKWKNWRWQLPAWRNNFYKELDFGKFSIFLGKGKNFIDFG